MVISTFLVTVKLISALVFSTQIVKFLYFLNLKFPVASHLCFVSDMFRNHVGFLMLCLNTCFLYCFFVFFLPSPLLLVATEIVGLIPSSRSKFARGGLKLGCAEEKTSV